MLSIMVHYKENLQLWFPHPLNMQLSKRVSEPVRHCTLSIQNDPVLHNYLLEKLVATGQLFNYLQATLAAFLENKSSPSIIIICWVRFFLLDEIVFFSRKTFFFLENRFFF